MLESDFRNVRLVVLAGVLAATAAQRGVAARAPEALPRLQVRQAGQTFQNGQGVFDVRSPAFGAAGDGVADDTAAIQRALNVASAGGGTVYFPPGQYRTTRELLVRAPNVSLRGAGPYLSVLKIAATADIGLSFDIPRLAPAITLSSDLEVGGRTVSVPPGAGKNLRAGAWLFLQDAAPYSGTFLTRIASIAGDTATIEEASPVAMTKAAGAKAYVYDNPSLLEGITIREMGFESAEPTPPSRSALVMLSRTNRALVENCRFSRSTGPLLTLRDSRGVLVWRSVFEDAASVAGAGIEGLQCTACSVLSSQFRMCPFGVVFSQSPHTEVAHNIISGRGPDTVNGRGIKVQHGSAFSRVVDNTITDAGLFGIYSSDSPSVLIAGNTILGTGTDRLQHGIQVGGYLDSASARNVVANNVLDHIAGDGIAVNPTNGRGKDLLNLVTGNQIHLTGTDGIQLVASRNLVSANVVTGFARNAIRADPGTTNNAIAGNLIGNGESTGGLAHEVLQLHNAGGAFTTSQTDATAGMFLFPGTDKYPAGATFTLYVLIDVERGTGAYQLLTAQGQPVAPALSTSSRQPAVVSGTLPAAQLPATTSYLEERLTAANGTAHLRSAFILVEW